MPKGDLDLLREAYLAAKLPYNAAHAALRRAQVVEEAAKTTLLAAKAAFVAAGGVLADLPPTQPEIETPPTVEED